MIDFWKTLRSHLQQGSKTFISLVAENTKGSPGTPGAKFLVTEGGDLHGTIGGGNMEYRLIDRAKTILGGRGFSPEVQTLQHRKTGEGEKSGMICSGSQTNIYYVCDPDKEIELVERLIGILQEDQSGRLTIDVNGLRVEDTEPDFEEPRISLVQRNGEWLYAEQLLNRKRLAIVGGGHCSVALCQVMAKLGYEVFIVDRRKDVFTLERATDAREIHIVSDYIEAGGLIRYSELTAVLIMTTDFLSDVRGLLGTVKLPIPFLGLMGSKAKIASIYSKLREEGIPQEKLDPIYAPVGLQIDSDTPEEIAISVAAQILQERNITGKFL